MKYLLTFLLMLISVGSLQAQLTSFQEKETTLIFVRHAEKADDGTKDPPLNEEGVKRAEVLSKLMTENFSISAVFSTPYKRTLQTAQPLAEKIGQVVQVYNFTDPGELLNSIKEAHSGSAVLIVGHSNTTPMLVNMLLGAKKYEQLPEDEYGKYFVVQLHPDGAVTDQKLSY
tara:strand:+ start:8583 stop:9098 length:516 start_codon:yes stop_codon:yes gene_type:complete